MLHEVTLDFRCRQSTVGGNGLYLIDTMDNRTMGKKMEKIQRKPDVNHGTFLELWEKESR